MNYHKDQKKKWLYRYIKNKENLTRLNERLEVLDQRITSIRSPGFSDMPRGGIPVTLEDLVADKAELEERITRARGRGLIMKQEISDRIHTLDNLRYVGLLEDRFIYGLSMAEIAKTLGCSERHAYLVCKEAIEALPWPDQQSEDQDK